MGWLAGGLELFSDEELGEEEPRAELRVEEVGCLGLEAEACLGSVRALKQGTCVDDLSGRTREASVSEAAGSTVASSAQT